MLCCYEGTKLFTLTILWSMLLETYRSFADIRFRSILSILLLVVTSISCDYTEMLSLEFILLNDLFTKSLYTDDPNTI